MKKTAKHPRIRVKPTCAVFWIWLLLCDRSPYTLISLTAALLHECGHLAAIALVGGGIERVTVYPFGIDMTRCGRLCSYGADFTVYAAGIFVNLLVCPFLLPFRHTPHGLFFLAANLALAALNLLPLSLLDGGGMLRCILLSVCAPDKADKIGMAVTLLFLIPLLGGCLYFLFFSGGNLSLLLLCGYLFSALLLSPERSG